MIAWTIYVSFATAILTWCVPAGRLKVLRGLSIFAALICCAVAGMAWGTYDTSASAEPIQFITRLPWIPLLGAELFLAADGISVVLVLLTAVSSLAALLFAWNIEDRLREFLSLFWLLIGSVYGVFLSFDLFLLFVFYELAIIPKYFLIAVWGSTRREYGAMKLVLYSFFASALVLVGLLATHQVAGGSTFDLLQLARHPFSETFQFWMFPLVFLGFAVLAGLWPLHTWAPTGHVAAPTPASMLLAGVVMKLGAYGAFRVAMTLFPKGMAAWREELALLAVVGILWGALAALAQNDFKFVIGYSSVSHMGFVLLGLASVHLVGLSGAIFQMFSHGLLAGLLFAVVGRMVYDRTHTRDLRILRLGQLRHQIPFAAGIFVLAGLAAMGLPGFSGFVAELQVLIGAWQLHPGWAVAAGLGILVSAVYTFRAFSLSFFPGQSPGGETVPGEPLPPISIPERFGAVLLLGLSLCIGLYPKLLLDLIVPSLNASWLQGLLQGGAP